MEVFRETEAGARNARLLSEIAYERLRDMLITLQIRPGEPIHEDKLVRELNVGRTPVREAVKRLSYESLVNVYPRRGTFASEIHLTDLAMISDLRLLLEGHAAFRAAERFTMADEPYLGELVARLGSGCSDATERMSIDADAHRFIYRCAGNPYLEDALSRNFNLSSRIWHLILDRLPDVTSHVQEHRVLLEAIADHDAERARQVAQDHVSGFFERVHSVVSPRSTDNRREGRRQRGRQRR